MNELKILDIFLLHFTKHSEMERVFRKVLEDFPGNTLKQRHSVTGVSLEYLQNSSETPAIEKRCFMWSPWKSPKTFLKSYS